MNLLYPLVLSIARTAVRICYRYSVYGIENFISGPALLCPNHASFLDPIIVSVSCPEPIHFLGKGALFNFSPFGWFIKSLNCHPLAKGKENLEGLKTVFRILGDNGKIFMAPEGTRTKDGELQTPLEGVGYIVLKSRCPVIPIYVDGTYRVWGRDRKYPKIGGNISCVFGETLYFDQYFESREKSDRAHIARDIMTAIAGIKTQFLKEQQKNLPPNHD
ncbi:MAG: lysophospholipid acyltransferase family protein [Victivallaceae bacterium]